MTWTQGDWDLHSQFVRYSHWDQHDSSLGGSSFSWQGYHLLNPKVGSDFSAPEKVTRSSTLFGNRRQQSCLDHISSVSSSLSFVSSVPKIPPGAHRTWCSSDHLPEELFSGKRFLSLQRDSKDRSIRWWIKCHLKLTLSSQWRGDQWKVLWTLPGVQGTTGSCFSKPLTTSLMESCGD